MDDGDGYESGGESFDSGTGDAGGAELYDASDASDVGDAELYDAGQVDSAELYDAGDVGDAELYEASDTDDSELYEAGDTGDTELYEGDELSNDVGDIDFETTMNTPYEQGVIREMDESGELDIPEEDPTLEDPEFGTQHLPTENSGTFEGERGDSAFVPNSEEARDAMAAYGQDAVEYHDGEPDFAPFTQHDTPYGPMECQVEIGHMTADRQNPAWEYGDRRPAGTSHDPAYDLGNFAQADNALVDRAIEQDPSLVEGKSPEEVAQIRADMARDIEGWRTSSGLTWHECQDGRTMQLVPTTIHDACRHSGGVSTMRTVQAYGDIRRAD